MKRKVSDLSTGTPGFLTPSFFSKGKIDQAGEEVCVEAVALVLEATVPARTLDIKHPMKGGLPALKSNAPDVVII
jgi:hypothetical protein